MRHIAGSPCRMGAPKRLSVQKATSFKAPILRCEFPILRFVGDERRKELFASLFIQNYRCGERVFTSQSTQAGLLYIAKGQMSFGFQNEKGNRLTLHRMTAMESCMLRFFNTHHYIEARAEEDSVIYLLPERFLNKLRRENAKIDDYCCAKEQKAYDILLSMIEQLAFSNLKNRLHRLLTNYAQILPSDTIAVTHETLANDLGTSREVITRILRQLEAAGIIHQERKRIQLLSPSTGIRG